MLLRLLFAFCLFLTATSAQAAETHDLLAKGGKGGWLNVTRPLTTEDMQGRIMVLDFWTYGCINCMQVVPDLAYLEEKFGDKLLIVGVHSAKFEGEQGSDRILFAAKRFGLKHPVINDSDFSIWNKFGVRAWPTLIVLDPQGKEIDRYEGEGHRDELDDAIAQALPSAQNKTTAIADILDKQVSGTTLSFPARLAYGATPDQGNILFVADSGHNRIVGLNSESKRVITIGNGQAASKDGSFDDAAFNHPRGIALVGNTLYVADTGNHLVRAVDLSTKHVTTIAGTGAQGRNRGAKNAPALSTAIASPWDLEALPNKKVAIAMAGTHQLWLYDTNAKTLSVLAGTGAEAIDDGPADASTLSQPSGLSVNGDTLFFVDAESSALRSLKGGTVNTLIGTGLFDFGIKDGKYPYALMQHPQGLYATDKQIVVADTYNNALRVYDRASGTLTTLKLTDTLNEPGDIVIVDGKALVADTNNHAIKSVDLSTGAVTTLPVKD